MDDYYKQKFTIADNVQDILHGQEVESREDLSSTFQVMEKISATGLQAVLHVLHNGQDIWKITTHKIRYLELYAKGYPLQVDMLTKCFFFPKRLGLNVSFFY